MTHHREFLFRVPQLLPGDNSQPRLRGLRHCSIQEVRAEPICTANQAPDSRVGTYLSFLSVVEQEPWVGTHVQRRECRYLQLLPKFGISGLFKCK